MKNWLSNPKVKLALCVNGLYLLSLYAPSSPHKDRPHLLAHARQSQAERVASRDYAVPAGQPEYVPLPPPSGPSRATAYQSGGLLHVSLSKDLTLVQRPDRTLLLSPSFSASTYPSEEPGSVRLNFIVYSDKETCPADCPLTIKADGVSVWPDYTRAGTLSHSPGWQRERVPRSTTKLTDGQVVETMAAESLSVNISYEQFLDTISAQRVIVGLGPDRVELTADQIEALRDMHRRLPEPPPTTLSDSY